MPATIRCGLLSLSAFTLAGLAATEPTISSTPAFEIREVTDDTTASVRLVWDELPDRPASSVNVKRAATVDASVLARATTVRAFKGPYPAYWDIMLFFT